MFPFLSLSFPNVLLLHFVKDRRPLQLSDLTGIFCYLFHPYLLHSKDVCIFTYLTSAFLLLQWEHKLPSFHSTASHWCHLSSFLSFWILLTIKFPLNLFFFFSFSLQAHIVSCVFSSIYLSVWFSIHPALELATFCYHGIPLSPTSPNTFGKWRNRENFGVRRTSV